jgi:NADPH:quinone reductase
MVFASCICNPRVTGHWDGFKSHDVNTDFYIGLDLMKAAWYEQQGTAESVLQIGEMPLPEARDNEVLIRLYASGINPSDVKRRQGARESMPYTRIIPHSDGAGIIEKVGARVPQDRIGERVWIYNAQWGRPYGTAAEFVALPAHFALPLPNNTSFEAGACLGIPAFTAHRCVFSEGSVHGKRIFVTGGAGSVGYYAVQFAKWGGARVIATVSNSEKAKHAKTAGADDVLNYREDNIIEKIKTLTRGTGVDHIVEVDFGENLSLSQEIIKLNGSIATYASMGNPHPQMPFYLLLFKGITLRFVNVYELPKKARYQAIKDIHLMLETRALTHDIAAQFPLDEIVAAHQFVESRTAIGNVVLTMR